MENKPLEYDLYCEKIEIPQGEKIKLPNDFKIIRGKIEIWIDAEKDFNEALEMLKKRSRGK